MTSKEIQSNIDDFWGEDWDQLDIKVRGVLILMEIALQLALRNEVLAFEKAQKKTSEQHEGLFERLADTAKPDTIKEDA